MIRVTIELESAITGKTTMLGQMTIANDGTGNRSRRNYIVAVARKGIFERVFGRMFTAPLRTGRVENFPSEAYNVWRLVIRALLSAFPEERSKHERTD